MSADVAALRAAMRGTAARIAVFGSLYARPSAAFSSGGATHQPNDLPIYVELHSGCSNLK
jgi:hypothetical protein